MMMMIVRPNESTRDTHAVLLLLLLLRIEYQRN